LDLNMKVKERGIMLKKYQKKGKGRVKIERKKV
jgi:hypothetical protein